MSHNTAGLAGDLQAILREPQAASDLAITLGMGRTRPTGRTVSLVGDYEPWSMLTRVIECHAGPEAWWSASIFSAGRSRESWLAGSAAVVDVDYTPNGAHAAVPAELRARIESALP